MPPLSHKQPLSLDDLPSLMDKWLFVGIDLAPTETLETGVAVVDRQRNLLRTDKLATNADILLFLENLGPPQSLIITLDVPKNLNQPNRWRQEEMKMHPIRILRRDGEPVTERFAPRMKDLYDTARSRGFLVLLFYSHLAKLRYQMSIPFRSRTPHGCRALQAMIKTRLRLQNMPSNLAPISVLDAMVGAYGAWSMFQGVVDRDFALACDADQRLYLDPLQIVPVKPTPRRRGHVFRPSQRG